MNREKRGWVSLALKTNALILAITFVLAAGLTTIAYYVNSERVDRYFKQTTSQAAAAVAYAYRVYRGDDKCRNHRDFVKVSCNDGRHQVNGKKNSQRAKRHPVVVRTQAMRPGQGPGHILNVS